MNAKLAVIFGAVYVACAVSSQQDEAPLSKDLAALQGTWKLVGFEADERDNDTVRIARWVIKKNKVMYAGEELATLTVDAGNPKIIDLNFAAKKKMLEGVYSLDGDTLKICVSIMDDGVKQRPLDFETKGKSDRRLLIFKRGKAGDDGTADANGFVGIQIKKGDDGMNVFVAGTLPKSPAEKAGLKKDDQILKIGATDATDLRQVVDLVRQAKPRSELSVRVRRGDKEHDIQVKVGVMPFFLLDF
jgi:uncharacterized protein (TIGR03067 family)